MPRSTANIQARVRFRRLPLVIRLLPLVLLCSLHQVLAAPVVTASIRPLHLIAEAVTADVLEPQLVWAQDQDPHHASLRPSERRSIAAADVVLWTGPMLEQPLAELADELGARLLTVQHMPGLHLLTVDGQPDPHVWLDTRNARLIATELAQTLARLDPANAARYQGNSERFAGELDRFDAAIQQTFSGQGNQAWAVYHHAFRYLEKQLGLQAPLMLADSENNPPGIRAILALREQVQQQRLACLLTEPGINHEEIRSMVNDGNLRIFTADAQGQLQPAGQGSYIELMQQVTGALADCLGGAP